MLSCEFPGEEATNIPGQGDYCAKSSFFSSFSHPPSSPGKVWVVLCLLIGDDLRYGTSLSEADAGGGMILSVCWVESKFT